MKGKGNSTHAVTPTVCRRGKMFLKKIVFIQIYNGIQYLKCPKIVINAFIHIEQVYQNVSQRIGGIHKIKHCKL